MIKEENTVKTLIINANLLVAEPTPAFVEGELLIEDGIIISVGEPNEFPRENVTLIDAEGALVSPGLVDVHTHGRAGGDFVSADTDQLQRMSKSYLSAGVTAVMPTLASAPLGDFGSAADRLAAVANAPAGARYLGWHLEGRYLNPSKRGAHAPLLLAPLDAAELASLSERMCRPYHENDLPCPMRVSAALELDEDGSFCAKARELGIRLSLGHTAATYEQASAAIERGATGLTHLYNTMPPLHHRAGGPVMACFDAARESKNIFGELICDGLHIAPEMIRLAYAMLGVDHFALISDSMEGTGCPDGDFSIAGQHVTLRDGRAYTDDGALAGSTLDLIDGVRNLMNFCNIPLAQALVCATRNPARLGGIDHLVGVLAPGRYADLLLLEQEDSRVTVRDVYVGGVRCEGVTA
jgi:N-acetylglucosamine-6-phosphate deacetylase